MITYANRSSDSGAGQVQGLPTRQVVNDPNELQGVPPAAQVPVGGIRAPSMPDLRAVSEPIAELGQALDGFDNSFTKLLYDQQGQMQVEGQMDYAQGKTQQDMAKDGNFYSQQGWQTMNMRANMSQFYTQAQLAITDKDREMSPTDYNKKLFKQWSDANPDITDPVLQKFNANLADQFLPSLVETQTKANNSWNLDNTKTALYNQITATASQVDPSNPGNTQKMLKGMIQQGSVPSLNNDLHNAVVAQSVIDKLKQGNSNVYDAIGGTDGMTAMGFNQAQQEGINTAYAGYVGQRGTDFANATTKNINSVAEAAALDGNRVLAQQRINKLVADVKTNPDSWSIMSMNVNPVDLSVGIHNVNKGADEAAIGAKMTILNQPAALQEISKVQAAYQGGVIKSDEYNAQIAGLATKYNVSNDDIKATMGVASDTLDQWVYKGAAQIQGALSSQEAKDKKVRDIQMAVHTGTVYQLGEGDQQLAADLQTNAFAGEAKGLIQNGQLPLLAGDSDGSQTVQNYVEQHFVPWLRDSGIVDKTTKQSDTAALSGPIVDSKGNVSTNAISAYSSLLRMTDQYGMSLDQVDKYVDGSAKDLFHQAKTFDLGGMNTADALKSAYEFINRPASEKQFIKPIDPTKVTSALGNKIDDDNSVWNRWMGNNAEGFGYTYRRDDERNRLVQDPQVNSIIWNTASTYKSYQPGLSDDAAISKATADVFGRSAYVGGRMIVSDRGSTLADDMHLPKSTQIRNENLAVMHYMRDFAGASVDHGGFGPQWNQFKVLGTDPYSSGLTGWLQNHVTGVPGQLSDSVQTWQWGVAPFATWYDANAKTFRFQMYADDSHQTTTGRIMEVPASTIGEYYTNKYLQTEQGYFEKAVGQTFAPAVQNFLKDKKAGEITGGSGTVYKDPGLTNLLPQQ